MTTIGVIGGSGLYEMAGLQDVERLRLETPFGDPSDEYVCGTLHGVRMVFLPRHGRGHRLLPTEVNYRANIFGMKMLGVEQIIGVGAVGSLREDVHPGELLVPDQMIDRTRQRPSTFFGRGLVAHVAFADPVCGRLGRAVVAAGEELGAKIHAGGVYVCMEGPQFSTRAESHLYRSWGGSVIGMTNLQEAKLAREAEICFATLALVTDYDCWRQHDADVSIEEILRIMSENVGTAQRLIAALVQRLDGSRECVCGSALEYAIITDRARIPERIKNELAPITGRLLGKVLMSIVVVGSVFFDTIETPRNRPERVLGGSATHFSLAASFFAPVRVVAAVGDDFPDAEFDVHRQRGVDFSGVEKRQGRTGSWTGRYHEDMNVRDTLALDLGVFADFNPKLPEAHRQAEYLFLGNIDPALQSNVLDQLSRPAVVACDTMNYWIENARPQLDKLLQRVQILLINDEEARQLSGEHNLVRAARKILASGPKSLLIKRGEYGVLHFSGDAIFAVPAFPLEEVFDPTGAGDAFAGGFLGALAKAGDLSEKTVRRAIVYGSVVASFIVEDFGMKRLQRLRAEEIEQRYRQFLALTDVH